MFDAELSKKFLELINSMTSEELYQRLETAEREMNFPIDPLIDHAMRCALYDLGEIEEEDLNLKIEKELVKTTPFETTPIYHDRSGRDMWDIVDKKCPYHRRESNQGLSLIYRIFHKHLGKTYSELKQIIKNKKSRYFENRIMNSELEDVFLNKNEDYQFDSEGKLELKIKELTTKAEFNPYRYRRFNPQEFMSRKEVELDLTERYEKFISMLEYKGYEVQIHGLATSFKGHDICGYISIDHNTPYYKGRVFAEYSEFYDKVSRCSLKFEIPKSKLGADSALKDLLYLGTKSAKEELINDTYEPKHVEPLYY